jgi:hypothetical protein
MSKRSAQTFAGLLLVAFAAHDFATKFTSREFERSRSRKVTGSEGDETAALTARSSTQ